ncbi:hypothetical protein D9619_000201 [Psilocybe cf. subviscida]|uniref:DDE-1 domain-containing protein n=1 Tax=Psilocybe cf. subviscida TaxID=2480587 RepID=A0A8H5F2V1_9AGAR|nr:hypothetical protein D9619_000201 [Psilocybe cf. subviscida]
MLANHPKVVKTASTLIKTIRAAGAVITIITARGILLAVIIRNAPEILTRTFADGSSFRVSESFVRKWLHDALGYSRRKGTQAAQKLPSDWEDQCERAAIRRAYLIKEEDIVAALVVNSDQTQVLYAPGDKMTWAEKGAKQVAVLGAEEKRAFTALISVVSDGTFLPLQAIYSGKTLRSCPSSNSPNFHDLMNAGCILQESGTTTYWSNIKTMKNFVNKILAPYFDQQKAALSLPTTQKSLWIIDVWSVHRSQEFRAWIKTSHPSIILDFVPGGCTSVAQPCDVGIQRPFKHSIKRSYHEDVVSNILAQMDQGSEGMNIDTRLAVLRNASTRWLWNAFQTLNNQELVKKSLTRGYRQAFEHCRVRKWDLSYETLTGVTARAYLRDLRNTNPEFWKELTSSDFDNDLPPEDVPQPEDRLDDREFQNDNMDDSDVPNQVVIQSVINPSGEVQSEYEVSEDGGLVSKGGIMAEGYDNTAGEDVAVNVVEDKELGRGKRRKVPNRRYMGFWKHNDTTASDSEE